MTPKQFLTQYQTCVSRVETLERQIVAVQNVRLSEYARLHPSKIQGASDSLKTQVAILSGQLEELRTEQLSTLETILRAVNMLEDEKEVSLLTYRYIQGIGWDEIARKMGITKRWTTDLHGRALTHVKQFMPEDFPSVPQNFPSVPQNFPLVP